MMMMAIAGAVIAGIIMWIGNMNYKKGVAWGQPVAVVFGIIAIACGIWAIVLNTKGDAGTTQKEVRYQEIRAEKLGAYLKQNFPDKKFLILTNGMTVGPDGKQVRNHQYDALVKAMSGLTVATLERPVPTDPDEMMMEEMGWGMRALNNLFEGKNSKGQAIDGFEVPGDFDILVTLIGLPEDAFRGGKLGGKLTGKQVAFLQGYIERWQGGFKNKSIVAAVTDVQYPGESDKEGLAKWEQNPPSDLDAAFNVRFILKTN